MVFQSTKINCHIKMSKKYVIILFSKGFGILECNFICLEKLRNEVKQIVHKEQTYNSYCVMTCINTIPSTSNTLNKLLLHKFSHSFYSHTKCNDNEEIINSTFITYDEPLSYDSNHPALL